VTSRKPTIAITIGDPAGIGPEIALKGLRDPAIFSRAEWKIVGDATLLLAEAKRCGLPPEDLGRVEIVDPGVLRGYAVQAGRLAAECGVAAVEYVRIATEMCLGGEADAMVTAPLNKEAVSMSGMQFSGHTEYIAELCGATDSRMLLSNEKLSVVHVSTHVSLRQATELKRERILRTIELGHEAMQWMGRRQPRIAVCGLNPHAGEHGLFGHEDEETILPAIEEAKAKGILCFGPTAPDTTFLEGVRGKYDLVVAMYHDQGHIPMKLIDFEHTVNISLGIPIIRTSVDHGTAFDIAGQNKADPRNMESALKMGLSMAEGRIAARAGERP
jgi:4-hydroxythreonine-4-phosphate dehydrogenase